jgi:hypothetical protein
MENTDNLVEVAKKLLRQKTSLQEEFLALGFDENSSKV